MRTLLDTNVVIRVGGTNAPLQESLVEQILHSSEIFLSPLSRVEIAIKIGTGKLSLPAAQVEFWNGVRARLQAKELPFTDEHAEVFCGLPLYHRDPFDRMIIAQAICEDLVIATTDDFFARYGVKTLI